jgi:Cu-Zn family superoxide dismutase
MNNCCINAVAKFDSKNVKGFVKFHQCPQQKGSVVYIDLYGLQPQQTKAIHIHEYGDEREGCKSLGSHWNPHNNTHGTILVDGMDRHAGDLINNIIPDDKGVFQYNYFDPLINLDGSIDESIIGRSVVIHDGIDDLGFGGLNNEGDITNIKVRNDSLNTGNAGSRMACAIIGRTKNGALS